ncbi:MAG: hypothetical protein KC636_30995 [Myxococcales bacterium]|nr:hypothetical protein [Myxococcales bacterium]
MTTRDASHRATGANPCQSLLDRLPEPGWRRVERLSLVRREIRESLSKSAVDLLWSRAEVVLEGGREPEADRYYVSAMVTIDLALGRDVIREKADAATAVRVAELMRDHEGVRARLAEVVRPELARLTGRPAARLKFTGPRRRASDAAPRAGVILLDHVVRAEGTRILIDGDAMVTLAGRDA